ncbi:MAG: phytanoyl-CoA dioxygenase family protein [Acidobacteria bacterium]|nr:phytanoyl-CoA dioxygenase family protein [Acidobacteriota bacterium]
MESQGFAVCRAFADQNLLGLLEAGLTEVETDAGVRSRGGVYAIRNLLDAAPAMRTLASTGPLLELARTVLGQGARPVRGLLFDKHPDANWLVPWHQDLTICLKERRHVEGFGPWSVKAGVVHVQPPAEILEQMVALRIHLDDAGDANGALRVLPGTHKLDRLTTQQVVECQQRIAEVSCAASRGDVLLMRPLLLHASSASEKPGRRRVVHIEYASCTLPACLHWHEEAVPQSDSENGADA